MGLGEMKDKLMNLGKSHSDKVDQGIDKASGAAKNKYGHDEQIDKASQKGKDYFKDGDQGQQPGQSGQQ